MEERKQAGEFYWNRKCYHLMSENLSLANGTGSANPRGSSWGYKSRGPCFPVANKTAWPMAGGHCHIARDVHERNGVAPWGQNSEC